jgi:hypothetical protein
LCISAAAPFDKLAVTASSPALHGFLHSLFSTAVLGAYLARRGQLGGLAGAYRRRPLMTLAAWLALGALGLQLVSYRGVMVGEVETIKRVVGLLGSIAAGRLLFKEPVTRRRLLTVVLMAVGVALLLS